MRLEQKTFSQSQQFKLPEVQLLVQKLTADIWKQHASQLGQKTTNLMKLNEIAAYLRETKQFHLNIIVPEFEGINDTEVKAFLLQQNVDVSALWDKFKLAQGSERAFLTPEALEILKTLQHAMEHAFDQSDFASPDLVKWIGAHNDGRLMVRSTGKEDTAEVSNPGGNESVAAVKPDVHAVSQAIKTVITSYLHPKSLEQRMLLGDDIFSVPFFPVLIQKMVGEPPGGAKIPEELVTSGVLFARESEGKTPETTHIQCAPGHAELIANGLGGFDTFHCRQDDIYSLIGVKDIRKVAAQEGPELVTVANSQALKNAPSLSTASLRDLHLLAQTIREIWQTDVDIEFSVSNEGIHLYQVRPASKTKETVPSYISDHAHWPCLRGVTIGAAGGAVRQIKKPDEVIIANTLKEALPRFLNLKDKSKIKAVLVKHWAPTNSHEAQFFRSVRIPTMAVQGVKEATNLWVDPQQGLVVQAESPKIEEGWVSHPIPALLSLLTWEGQKDLGPFWQKLAETYRQLPEEERKIHSLEDLRANFETVKFGQRDDVLKALSKIVFYAQNRASHDQTDSRDLVRIFQNILGRSEAAYHVASQSDAPILSRLYTANFLEAALFQTPSQEFVSNDSLVSALSNIKLEEKLQARLPPEARNDPFVLQLAKAGSLSLHPENRKQWEDFVVALSLQHPEDMQKLARIIVGMQKFDQLALWMNVSFPSVWKAAEHKPRVCVNVLMKQFINNQGALQWMDKVQQATLSAQKQMGKWEEPKHFEKQFSRFQRDFIKAIDFKDAKVIFDKSTRLGKLAILQSLRSAIDVFDQSIKSMKNSPEYENDRLLQVERFQLMLEPYLQLLEDVYQSMTPDMKRQLDPFNHSIFLGSHDDPDYVIKKIRELFEDRILEPSMADLKASSNFSVAAAQLGSGTNFDRHLPSSLEDMFTLIHQDLNSLLSLLGLEYGMSIDQLPEDIKIAAKEISSIELPSVISQPIPGVSSEQIRKARPNLLGVDLEYPHVLSSFGLPLVNHSSQIQLKSNPEKHRVELTFSLFGHNDGHRMDYAVMTALLGSQLSGLTFKEGGKPKYDPSTLSLELTWDINLAEVDPQRWQEIISYIRMMIAWTVPGWRRTAFQKQGFTNVWNLPTLIDNLKKLNPAFAERQIPIPLVPGSPFPLFFYACRSRLWPEGMPVDDILETITDLVERQELPDVNSLNYEDLAVEQMYLQTLLGDVLNKLEEKHPSSDKLEKALFSLLDWKLYPFYSFEVAHNGVPMLLKVIRYLNDTNRIELANAYLNKVLAFIDTSKGKTHVERRMLNNILEKLEHYFVLNVLQILDDTTMQMLNEKFRKTLFKAELAGKCPKLFNIYYKYYRANDQKLASQEMEKVLENEQLAVKYSMSYGGLREVIDDYPNDAVKLENVKKAFLEALKRVDKQVQVSYLEQQRRYFGTRWPLFIPTIREHLLPRFKGHPHEQKLLDLLNS